MRPKIVAVGEIGLDYYWDKEKREIQKEWFVRQLRLAKELKKTGGHSQPGSSSRYYGNFKS